MARSFRRGKRNNIRRSQSNKNTPLSPRAFRNEGAREANQNRPVRTADGTVYKNYTDYKNDKPIEYPSITTRPVNNNRPSLNTRQQRQNVLDEYLRFQNESKGKRIKTIQEERKDNLLDNLRHSNSVLTDRALKTGNPLLMRQAAITETIVLESNGMYSSAYTQATDIVREVLEGKYNYGVSQAELDKWVEENTYWTTTVDTAGNEVPVKCMRYGAAPPPVGYDKDGNTVDIANAWRYYQQVDQVRTKNWDVYNKSKEERASLYSNHLDEELDTHNSVADVLTTFIAGDGSVEAIKDYLFNTYLRPLSARNMGAFGLNLLNDLGETLDLLPRGVKAIAASQQSIYGNDGFFTNEAGASITHAVDAWVYSGGKEKQKQLIDLGALDILEADRYTQGYRSTAIEAIKEAGLWDEYLKFEEEYRNNYEGKFDFKSAGEYLKRAYTTHDNFEADTGALVSDLAVELITDPSLVLGGAAKGVSKAGVKSITDSALSTALEAANKNLNNLDEVSQKFLNSQMKQMGDNLLSKGKKNIQYSADTISKELINKGVFSAREATAFRDTLVRNLLDKQDSKSFNIVKSLHYIDRGFDTVDRTLLKSVFAIPYLSVKSIKKGTLKYKTFRAQALRRTTEGLVDKVTDTIPIYRMEEVAARLKQEPQVLRDENHAAEVYNKIAKHVDNDINSLKKIITEFKGTVDELDLRVNEFVKYTNDLNYSSLTEYASAIDEAVASMPGIMDDVAERFHQVEKLYNTHRDVILKRELMNAGEDTTVIARYGDDVSKAKKEFELPIADRDKLIDRQKRITGSVKKQWQLVAKKYEAYFSNTDYAVFFKSGRKAPTIGEVQTVATKLLNDLQAQMIGPMSDIQKELYEDMRRLYNSFVEAHANIDVEAGMQYNIYQQDKYKVYQDVMSNTLIKKVLDLFGNPESEVNHLMDEILQEPGVSKASIAFEEMVNQYKSVQAFDTFFNRLEAEKILFTEEEKAEIIDTLFNREWIDSVKLIDKEGTEMNTLIDKLNIRKAMTSDVSLSLDGFRKAVTDFEGDIWSKYSSEISDLAMQKRVYSLISGGHEDPLDDVKVQMLQLILRDPDSIARYNTMSKNQDVLFYDLETRGTNKTLHEITSVAIKKWDPFSTDNPTLDEILTMLEKGESKTSKIFIDPETLDKVMSKEILEVNYKNNPKVGNSRAEMLAEYKKGHSSAANNGVEVLEKEMLNDVMEYLDSSAVARNKPPVLVSHNNNNFDKDFLRSRCSNKNNKVFPSHMKDLNALLDIEENTYFILRHKYSDNVLSAKQIECVRDLVSDYARDMHKWNDSMRIFKPGEFIQSVKNFVQSDVKAFGKNGITIQTRLSEILDDLVLEQESLLKSLNEDKSIIARDSMHISIANMDEAGLAKYLGENAIEYIKTALREQDTETIEALNKQLREVYHKTEFDYTVHPVDSTMRMMLEKNPDYVLPEYGYKTLLEDLMSEMFEITGESIPYSVLMRMNSFAKSCSTTVAKRLKSNTLLLKHMDDFKAVIELCQKHAQSLEVFDEYYFLKYIKAPESVEELYVVAQKCYDMFTETTKFEEAKEYLGVALADIPEELRGPAVLLQKFGDDFVISKHISEEADALLSNRGNAFHPLIYKDSIKTDKDLYLNDLLEDEILQDTIIESYKQDEFALETASTMYVSNSTTKAKDHMIASSLKESRRVFEHYAKSSVDDKARFNKECTAMMEKMAREQTDQIMRYITQSEHNLISHLLFHNQLLVLPISGSAEYMSQLSDLMKVLDPDSKYITYKVDHNDFMWIGLKKEWNNKLQVANDSRYIEEEAVMSFFGEAELYTKPTYKRIVMGEPKVFTDEAYNTYFIGLEEQVLRLSKGGSAGSLGLVHTMRKQRNLYANAPSAFRHNALDVEFTCNERLWHNANYDMSIIGEWDYRWKLKDINDTDYLLASRETLKESAKKAQAERLFIDGLFNGREHMSISKCFEGVSDKEIAGAFKDNRGMVAVSLRESKSTESGFMVEAIDTTTVDGVKLAKASDAIVIPYDMYQEIFELVNKSSFTNSIAKVWSKIVSAYKTGYLCNPGTWMRNFMDATIKAIGDTGDPTGLLANYVRAGHLKHQYTTATRALQKMRGIDHNVTADLRRVWDVLSKENNLDISLEQYLFMDSWHRSAVSGGESSILEGIRANREAPSKIDSLLQTHLGTKDIIADTVAKFEMLPEDVVVKLFNEADLSTVSDMSLHEFLSIYKKWVQPDDVRWHEYRLIVDTLLEGKGSCKKTLGNRYQDMVSAMFKPMSAVEEMVRLGEFLTLEQQGYTKSEIFRTITESQFIYDVKAAPTKRLEMIIPFYSFAKSNMIYWAKQIGDNPRMLRYLEKIWGELSWDFSDVSPEEIASNGALENTMLSGNVPIGKTGLTFKLNPSFMDAFAWLSDPVNKLYSSVFTPLQPYTQEFVYMLGDVAKGVIGFDIASDDIFGYKSMSEDKPDLISVLMGKESYTATEKFERLPIVPDLFEHWLRPAWSLLTGPEWGEGALEDLLPSLFKYYEEQPEQSGDLSWDELVEEMARKGKLWDENQKEFVKWDQFIPGGLNDEFDFSQPGEWDRFCELKKKYLNEAWDNNLRKFVPMDELTPGGLNDPDATWEEVLYYNARQGLFYNQEIGEFVDISEWPMKEQEIIRYTFFGEQYDEERDRWVQVTNPMKGFGTVVEVSIREHEDDPSFFEKIGVIATVFADDPDVVRSLVRAPSKYFEAVQEDLDTFMAIMEKLGLGGYSKPEQKQEATGKFKSGFHNNIRTIRTRKPQESTPSRYAKAAYQGVKSAGTIYSKPYQYNGNMAGLKMATSGYPAYDEYYNYNYVYSYKYRNPNRGVADFPQSKLGIQRYMRLRTDALTRKMRLRAEYNISDINSLRGVTPKNRIQSLKLHWWMR